VLTCREVEPMLQDYLDGYLLPSQREVLEGHVRRCAHCRTLLEEMTRIDERLDAVGEVEVPEGLAGLVLASLPAETYRRSPMRRAMAWGGVPALLLLLLAAGALFRGRFELNERTGERLVEMVLAAPQAASVAVVGDFNGWDPHRNAMNRAGREGTWRVRLRLHPGVYQYSFVIDGREWLADPTAERTAPDGFGGENSIMVVDG
jgi:anti-sigma factor RsiW